MRNSIRRLTGVSLLGLVGLLALPTGATAATSNLAISVPAIGGMCFFVEAPADHTLALVWKDSTGAVKEIASVPTGGVGNPLFCSSDNVVAVGDKIKVADGSKSHKLTIPRLYAAINRVTDVVSGTAPAGKRIRIECGGSPFGQFEPCQYTRNVTASSAGNWSLHIPFDMFGGFVMYAHWKNSYGDEVYRKATTPYFQVLIGQGRFFGVTQPLSEGTVNLEDSSHNAKGMGIGESGPLEGSFVGQLRDGSNHVVTVVPGDYASSDVASDASFVVPTIQATATAADDHVMGHCEVTDKYKDVYVEVYRGGKLRGAGGSADNLGDFDFNFQNAFPRPVDVKVGDKLYINCIQGEGDWVTKVITAQ